MIARVVIERVNRESDLVALVRETSNVRKIGSQHVTICPFHPDTKPSLVLYKNHYHCYVCQSHGGAIDWCTKVEAMRFNEAVQYLADKLNIAISNEPLVKKRASETAAKREQAKILASWWTDVRNYILAQGSRYLCGGDDEWLNCLYRLRVWMDGLTAQQKYETAMRLCPPADYARIRDEIAHEEKWVAAMMTALKTKGAEERQWN